MGWIGRGGAEGVDHGALCSLRPVKLFIVPRSSPLFSASPLSFSVRAHRPLCPFPPLPFRSSLRPFLFSLLSPETPDNYCRLSRFRWPPRFHPILTNLAARFSTILPIIPADARGTSQDVARLPRNRSKSVRWLLWRFSNDGNRMFRAKESWQVNLYDELLRRVFLKTPGGSSTWENKSRRKNKSEKESVSSFRFIFVREANFTIMSVSCVICSIHVSSLKKKRPLRYTKVGKLPLLILTIIWNSNLVYFMVLKFNNFSSKLFFQILDLNNVTR